MTNIVVHKEIERMIFQAQVMIVGMLKSTEFKTTQTGKAMCTVLIAGENDADLPVVFWNDAAKKAADILPDQAVVISGVVKTRKSKNGQFTNIECWGGRIDVLSAE